MIKKDKTELFWHPFETVHPHVFAHHSKLFPLILDVLI